MELTRHNVMALKSSRLLEQLVNLAHWFAYSPFLLNLLGTSAWSPYIRLRIVSQKILKIILNVRRVHEKRERMLTLRPLTYLLKWWLANPKQIPKLLLCVWRYEGKRDENKTFGSIFFWLREMAKRKQEWEGMLKTLDLARKTKLH